MKNKKFKIVLLGLLAGLLLCVGFIALQGQTVYAYASEGEVYG